MRRVKNCATWRVALLSDGHDDAMPLAILDDLAMSEVGPTFERAGRAMGQPIPLLADAIDIVIAALLRDIANATVVPEIGLGNLMDDVVRPYVEAETTSGRFEYAGQSRDLQDLIGAYCSYDEIRARPDELSIDTKFGDEAISILDERVVAAARDWLNKHDAVQ